MNRPLEHASMPTRAAVSLSTLAVEALLELAHQVARESDELARLLALTSRPVLAEGWLAALEEPCTFALEDEPILHIARVLGLGRLELLALALIAALEEEPLLGRVVALLQAPTGGAYPQLGFLASVFRPLATVRAPMQTLAASALFTSGLLLLEGETRPLAERTGRLRTPLYLALRDVDAPLAGTTLDLASQLDVPLPRSTLEQVRRHAEVLRAGEQKLTIRSGSPAEGRAIARTMAADLGVRALFIESEQAPEGLGAWLTLRRALPVFCWELGPGERRRLPVLAAYQGPMLAVLGPDGVVQSAGGGIAEWQVGIPSRAERERLWRAALGDEVLAAAFACEHRHGAGRIAHLGRIVTSRLGVDERPTREHVRSAAWVAEGAGLGGLAIPVTESVGDDALVTEPQLQEELGRLAIRCRARDGLDEQLGAALRARYRPGVRALFVGPSGTGKTLAASWLACRLGVPLYRVDLAAVTSKYIGETEKNLAQLLARAEHDEVVLLFDEADSMFGKRTDVKDANDRFANAQTNYLLQRMESFDGIAILTSNSRTRFDAAFTRRLDAVIDFALPGPEQRRGLWASHLGSAHELSPTMLNKLAATTELTGGHIRNVVLTAAVLACAEARKIRYPDVITGLTAELKKLGRPVPHELRGGV